MAFQKAVKEKAKLRLALIGPSGSGKSFSALRIATGLGGKIAFIDTERNSGCLYADIFDFDHDNLNPPFTVENYIRKITEAEQAGYDTIIIDSISHEWEGEGGLLEQHEKITQASKSKNSYNAWATITPKHQLFIGKMMGSPCHIIATMRSKTEYERDENSKTYRKVGTAPKQRDGMDYEFTACFDLSVSHYATPTKHRCGELFDINNPFIPTEETGEQLLQWLNTGREPMPKQNSSLDFWKKSFWNEYKKTGYGKDMLDSYVLQYAGKPVSECNSSDFQLLTARLKATVSSMEAASNESVQDPAA